MEIQIRVKILDLILLSTILFDCLLPLKLRHLKMFQLITGLKLRAFSKH